MMVVSDDPAQYDLIMIRIWQMRFFFNVGISCSCPRYVTMWRWWIMCGKLSIIGKGRRCTSCVVQLIVLSDWSVISLTSHDPSHNINTGRMNPSIGQWNNQRLVLCVPQEKRWGVATIWMIQEQKKKTNAKGKAYLWTGITGREQEVDYPQK